MKHFSSGVLLSLSLALASCEEDQLVLDSYSTMRYDVLALPTAADTMALHTVEFISAREGFVGGEGGSIFATTDGGQTWTRRPAPTPGTIYKLLFTSPTQGWAGTAAGLYRTTDGGQSWQYRPTYDNRGSLSSVRDLQFVTPQLGYAVGGNGSINKTTNGGSTWSSLQRRLDANFAFYGVSFTSVDSGTVVGANSAYWRTTNGGFSWDMSDRYSGTGADVNADVLRYNADTYLLTGYQGFGAHGVATGCCPDRPDESYGYSVYGLASAGPGGPVVAVGQHTVIRRHQPYSLKEHTPWVNVHAPDGTSLPGTFYAADFADEATFYAVGPRGTIHRFHYQ